MKKAIYLVIIVLLGISCKKEGCTDSTATNYDEKAKKDDGSCIFPVPPPDAREVYLGGYNVTDSTFLGGPFYEVKNYILTVALGTNDNELLFSNLFNSGNSYYGIIDTLSGNFSVPSQQVSGPYYITGSGNFVSDSLYMNTSGDVYVNKIAGKK